MAVPMNHLGSSVGQLLEEAAATYGDKPYVRFGDGRVLTYADLETRSRTLARILLARGLRRGDTALSWLPACPEWFVSSCALARIGVVNALANIRYRAGELGNAIDVSQPSMLFFAPRHAGRDYQEVLRAVLAERDLLHAPDAIIAVGPADGYCAYDDLFAEPGVDEATFAQAQSEVTGQDPLHIIYTSGTTGAAKGSASRHGAVLKNSYDAGLMDAFDEHTRFLHVLPLFHCFGIRAVVAVLQHGGTLVVQDPFDAAEALELIEREHITHLYAVPTHLVKVVEAYEESGRGHDLSSWLQGVVGGGTVTAELAEQIDEVLQVPHLTNAYGMTECTAGIAQTLPDWPRERRLSTVGVPLPDVKLRIVRQGRHNEDAPAGEAGEICVSGYGVHAGYYGSDASIVDDEGWLHTGDIGRIDAETGDLEFLGRYKDMYKSSGENVYPSEVEAAIENHEAVLEAAVVGVPDPTRGEVGVAFVKLHDGAELDQPSVLAYLAERIAKFKSPVNVEFVDEFPRSFATQKIQKHLLVAQATTSLERRDGSDEER